MWLLFSLILLNSAVGSHSFLFQYRVTIAGMPVNLLDGLTILAFIAAILRTRSVEEPPRGYKWALGLLVFSNGVGLALGLANMAKGLDVRVVVTVARDFFVLPICVLIGYRLLPNIRSVKFAAYTHVLAGVITGLAILIYYKGRTESYQAGGNYLSLRTIDYISGYAGAAGCLILFGLFSGIGILWWPLTLVALPICVWGCLATLVRSDWLAFGASVSVTLLAIPSQTRFVTRAVRLLVMWVVLLVVIVGGVKMGSSLARTDMTQKLWGRVLSMIPGGTEEYESKAWDTRLPGIKRELEIWGQNVLTGGGFGVQGTRGNVEYEVAYNHNSWTSTLAQVGLLGLAAIVMLFGVTFYHSIWMISDRTDPATTWVGGFGVAVTTFLAVLGMATGSWNHQRGGIFLGTVCGIVLRARAIQQQMVNELAGYLTEEDLQQEMGTLLDSDGLPASMGW